MDEVEVGGAVLGEWGGVELPRHYGSPDQEYRSAVEGIAVADRSYRSRLTVTGRAPAQMIQGIITNSVPPLATSAGEDVLSGKAAYAAVLTRKGKMVTDLRLLRAGDREEDGLLLDLPLPGAEEGIAHFRKFLPPRMARLQDVSDVLGMLTVTGPEAAAVLSREALGLRVEAHELEALPEGGYFRVGAGPGGDADNATSGLPLSSFEGLWVLRSMDVATPAFDLLGNRGMLGALRRRLLQIGGAPLGHGSWEALRIEAGRPAFGSDLDADTIPIEAGIEGRAIDHGKGCYTGQEVIVRIRDRGRVNRLLRGLLVGDAPTPALGTELFREGEERAMGRVTSAALSPRAGQCIALGYLRREVEPGDRVRLGSPSGSEAEVRELTGPGWAFGEPIAR